MHCYCSICRKTQGGGGFAINIGARYDTLVIDSPLPIPPERNHIFLDSKPD
jgi:hypothetical protein